MKLARQSSINIAANSLTNIYNIPCVYFKIN